MVTSYNDVCHSRYGALSSINRMPPQGVQSISNYIKYHYNISPNEGANDRVKNEIISKR